MKQVCIFILLLIFMSLSYAKNWPLVVNVSTDWQTEYSDYTHLGLSNVQSFNLTHVDDESVYFYFALSSITGDRNQAKELVKLQVQVLDEDDESSDFPELSYIDKIEGVEFAGEAAVFLIGANLLHASFHISNGSKIWSGQYDGPRDTWIEAKSMLNSLRQANEKGNTSDGLDEPPVR